MVKDQKTAIRVLTLGAILTALGVVLIYLGSVMPTMRLSLLAVAGVLPCVIVLTGGVGHGFVTYGATALLAVLVVPDKTAVLVYALLFGHYPMFKSLAERTGKRPLEWLIKLGVFNAALTAMVILARTVMSELFTEDWAVWLIYLAGNVIFLLYDFAFSGVITFFNMKFGKYLRRKR